ncbi:hypothetical protein Lepto7375DRAFT_7412 [Leptolyngbya sp. PCC 7375]|nr:hypothetical protein Lepto7375DRAFT_7412 [Leptolyngbya sp. PCC 7375]
MINTVYQTKGSSETKCFAHGNLENLTINELFDLAAQMQANKAKMDLINYHVDYCGPFDLTDIFYEVTLSS